jgi:nucleolar protein 16
MISYAALGLVHSLNPLSSGGTEQELHAASQAAPQTIADSPLPVESAPQVIPKGHGKIIRDDAGKVIGVELAEEEQNREGGEKDMEEIETELGIDGEVMANWVDRIGGGKNENAKNVVQRK